MQEAEVAPFMRLGDFFLEEFAVAAGGFGRAGPPLGAAAGELGFGDVEVEAAGGDVELDDVAVADEGEGTAEGRGGGRE